MEYKGYLIEVCSGSMRCIKPKGKGSVVKRLKGLYTTPKEAMKAIDIYLNTKGRRNDKTTNNS